MGTVTWSRSSAANSKPVLALILGIIVNIDLDFLFCCHLISKNPSSTPLLVFYPTIKLDAEKLNFKRNYLLVHQTETLASSSSV